VVGVDAEVVAPGARAVPRVILGTGRATARVVRPVVEAAEPDQEADGRGHQLDGREDRALPDGVPRDEPADQDRQAQPDAEEERRHPEHAEPTRRGEATHPRRAGSGQVGVLDVDGGGGRHLTSRSAPDTARAA
jgi:hypothetical protein